MVVLDNELYEEIAKRLDEAGFAPDVNDAGNLTAQRWKLPEGVTEVTRWTSNPPRRTATRPCPRRQGARVGIDWIIPSVRTPCQNAAKT